MAKKRSRSLFEIPVDFGRVGIGANSVSIPVKIPREAFDSLKQADDTLCGHRLTGTLQSRPKDESSAQGTLDGFEPEELAGIFDVKSYSVHPEYLSATLNFTREDVNLDQVGAFAAKAGKLIVDDVGDLENGDGEHEEEDEAGGGE